MSNNQPFYETPHPPLSKMSKDEMQEELQNWRNLWSWVDNEVQGWLIKVGHTFKFIRRDYRTFFGTLGKVHFEPKLLELDCVVEEKDYIHRRIISEVETIYIQPNQLINYEEVFEHHEVAINERGEEVDEEESKEASTVIQ